MTQGEWLFLSLVIGAGLVFMVTLMIASAISSGDNTDK